MDQNPGEVKVILLGDVGVGKSNIAFRFVNDFFLEDSEPTLNSNFMSKVYDYNGTVTDFKIWDTAGNEKFRSMTSLYFKRAKVALIVFDVTRKETFYGITSWIKQLTESAPADILIAVVGNKTDLVDQEQISLDEIGAFAKDHVHFYQMADTVKDKAQAAKDKTHDAAQAAKDKTYDAAQAAKDKTTGATQTAGDKTRQSKDETGSYLSEKAGEARDKAAQAADYTKQKASDAAEYTKESAVAGKDKTGGFIQATGEQVRSMAQGAADAVKHTLGMGGTGEEAAGEKTTPTTGTGGATKY